MKQINVKEHTTKYMKLAKDASNGTYPNKKVAKIGSITGLIVGGILVAVGIYGLTKNAIFGTGSLLAGILTIGSNAINIKRIKSK